MGVVACKATKFILGNGDVYGVAFQCLKCMSSSFLWGDEGDGKRETRVLILLRKKCPKGENNYYRVTHRGEQAVNDS
jgi:hypothetical protein